MATAPDRIGGRGDTLRRNAYRATAACSTTYTRGARLFVSLRVVRHVNAKLQNAHAGFFYAFVRTAPEDRENAERIEVGATNGSVLKRLCSMCVRTRAGCKTYYSTHKMNRHG